ncbi:hypothetical protein RSOLAG22IIIB_06909 [Rhizoctonia solani]|uniref:F-box domain-containing protein n=1 Tax=Rhizoctonia solani TaxID=456999 RepID=A0A0K6GHS4_9AGAM|nr:hypothetical protein RSOLAG22IIIB_06909 [Rhizoctonia solani]
MTEVHKPLSLPVIVEQWKETGSALADSLSSYLDSCLLLSKASENTGVNRSDLISHFDSALQPGALLTTLSEQLAKSREVLSKARNKLASPIYNFPPEILSKIFLYFVEDDSDSPTYVEFTVRTFYHRVHTLLGVCSVWRNVGISMPHLWNLVPVIRDVCFTLSWQATSLSLRRSKTLPLDLAVMIPHVVPERLAARLAKHASRFRTINISAEEPCTIQEIMDPLLNRNVCDSLTELSLCVSDLEQLDRLDNHPYYMFSLRSPTHPLLVELLQSITRFRLFGATLDWSQVTFSARMVEIRIHSVIIGGDSVLHELIRSLSTAPELQKLELASITSFPADDLDDIPPIVLPKLKSLVLEDLYFNTLSTVLHSIAPLSQQLSLCLTDRSIEKIFSARDPDLERETISVYDLIDELKGVSIHTLLLANRDRSFKYLELAFLLKAVSPLNTLKINNWTIDQIICGILQRRKYGPTGHVQPPVIKLRNLHLTNARIADQEGLKDTIRVQGLEAVLLGGYINCASEEPEEPEDWEPLEGEEEIVKWLADHVPTFHFMPGGDYRPPELLSAICHL